MKQTDLLLEYLKEHYAQARQHENRQTTATTFLTATAGAIVGLTFSQGKIVSENWWLGLIVFLIGLANWWINETHFKGNRFHTTVAGRTREALEKAIMDWSVPKPSDIRKEVVASQRYRGPNFSIGSQVHGALRLIPIGVMLLGIAIAIGLKVEFRLRPTAEKATTAGAKCATHML